MKTSTRIGVIVMAVWVTAWGAREAAAATVHLTQKGKTYKIHNDLHDAIVISADDVTLDCQGHLIIGESRTAPGRGIFAKNVNRVRIRDCTVTEWNVGISINGGEGHRVFGVHLHHNAFGISLAYTTDVEISEGLDKRRTIIESNEFGIYLARAIMTKLLVVDFVNPLQVVTTDTHVKHMV